MAQLVEALAKANVAAIGFDVLFSEKDRPSDDMKACAQGAVHRADDSERCKERADSDLAFGSCPRQEMIGVAPSSPHER